VVDEASPPEGLPDRAGSIDGLSGATSGSSRSGRDPAFAAAHVDPWQDLKASRALKTRLFGDRGFESFFLQRGARSSCAVKGYLKNAELGRQKAAEARHTKAASRTADLLPVVDAIRADGITSAL